MLPILVDQVQLVDQIWATKILDPYMDQPGCYKHYQM